MKETLIKLGTGLIAKLLRYAINGVGATAVFTSAPDGKSVDVEQLAGGLAAVVVSVLWSLWADRVKKAKAESKPLE